MVNGIGVESGDCVVTTNVEHGSGMVPAYYQRERSGCDVQIVPIGAQVLTGRGDGVVSRRRSTRRAVTSSS